MTKKSPQFTKFTDTVEFSTRVFGESEEYSCNIMLEDKYKAHTVAICNRDLLFYCDNATLNYVVDTIGYNHYAELINLEEDNKTEKVLSHLNLENLSHQSITLSRSKFLELNALGLLNLDERQNNGPTIGDMIYFTCNNPNIEISFDGYIIGTERSDHRLTIDSMTFRFEELSDLALIVNKYHYADEFTVKGNVVKAWWD